MTLLPGDTLLYPSGAVTGPTNGGKRLNIFVTSRCPTAENQQRNRVSSGCWQQKKATGQRAVITEQQKKATGQKAAMNEIPPHPGAAESQGRAGRRKKKA